MGNMHAMRMKIMERKIYGEENRNLKGGGDFFLEIEWDLIKKTT